MCERCNKLEADVAKYRARLEVDHYFTTSADEPNKQKMIRVEVPYVSADEDIGSCDGISCRDETIKLQDEAIARLRGGESI